MDYCGLLWITVDYCRLLWITVDYCGLLWITVDYCGLLYLCIELVSECSNGLLVLRVLLHQLTHTHRHCETPVHTA